MTRVLIADDEAVILLQLEDVLGAMGFDVVALATNADEAVARARETQPDAALLDVVMPGAASGIDACRTLQGELGIPVVLMSAHGDEANLARAAQAEPAGYVIKPFQPDQVAAALRMAVLARAQGRLSRLQRSLDQGLAQASQWTLALERLPLGAALCDERGAVIHANAQLRALFGPALGEPATLGELPGARTLSGATPDGAPILLPPLARGREIEARMLRLGDGGTLVCYADVTDQRRAGQTLADIERTLETKHRIAEAFLTIPDLGIHHRVAALLAEGFGCALAAFGHMDAQGGLVLPPPSGPGQDGAPRTARTEPLPPELWAGPWGEALRERHPALDNDRPAAPPGHPAQANALAVPILLGNRLVGLILLADKDQGFDEDDVRAAQRVAAYCAPILQSRLEREAMNRERTQAAQELMHSERRHRQIVETSLEGVWTIDAGGLTTYVNRNLAQMLGYTPEDMLGRHHFEFMDRTALREAERRLEKCRMGYSAQYDFRFKSATGADVWAICSTSPLTEPDGSYGGALVMTSNITYRKFAENSLLESEERFRQLVENLREVFWIREAETGRALYISPSLKRLWGREVEEFQDSRDPFYASIYHEDRELVRAAMSAPGGDGPREAEYRILRPDGEQRWVRTSSLAIPDANGRPFREIGISEDITERKLAAQERDRLIRAIEQVGDIVIITDPRGTIQYVNPAFTQISGLGARDVLGRNMALLQSPQDDGDYLAGLQRALVRGVPWRGRYQYERPGATRREVRAVLSPIFDDLGRVAHYVSVQRDVTEETLLENQLHQARKMEALGTLAGGIAHDFNNILMAILGFTELAQTTAPEHGKQRAHLDRVLEAGTRARDLVRQILAFSRQGELERIALDPVPLIKETLKLLRATLPANVAIHRDLDSRTCKVLADPGQVHQIVMNLATNAAHALDGAGGGTITVRLRRKTLAPAPDGTAAPVPGLPQELTSALAPGDYLLLEVQDDGPGIPGAILDRVFDPFFTTKAPGEGTGMGLSVVHGTVHALGGAVHVACPQRGGALFRVLLPRAQERQDDHHSGPDHGAQGGERVLFVDDEHALAELAEHTLGTLGYQVTALTSPQQALEAFAAAPHDFDILVSDQAMPGATGLEMIRSMHAIRPDLPVILCTGHSRSATPQAIREAGVDRLLQKPLRFEDLSRSLRDVLDTARK